MDLEIKTFDFSDKSLDLIKKEPYGLNWPVVYIIENGVSFYVGETTRAYSRLKQHLEDKEKSMFKNIHFINYREFNKSITLNFEYSLINFFLAEEKNISNKTKGNIHNYYNKENYESKFEDLLLDLK